MMGFLSGVRRCCCALPLELLLCFDVAASAAEAAASPGGALQLTAVLLVGNLYPPKMLPLFQKPLLASHTRPCRHSTMLHKNGCYPHHTTPPPAAVELTLTLCLSMHLTPLPPPHAAAPSTPPCIPHCSHLPTPRSSQRPAV